MRKAHIVLGKRTSLKATKFGREACDSQLNRIKRGIFQKSVNKGKIYFEALYLRD